MLSPGFSRANSVRAEAPRKCHREWPAQRLALPKDRIDATIQNGWTTLRCLRRDEMLNAQMGKPFIDYLCHIKEAEIARFNLEVSEWEHREYFDMF